MYKLLVIPVAAYIQAWFDVLNENYITAGILGTLAFILWLAILDTVELLKEVD